MATPAMLLMLARLVNICTAVAAPAAARLQPSSFEAISVRVNATQAVANGGAQSQPTWWTGVAIGLGRAANCTVCLDGSGGLPPNGMCEADEIATRTDSSGSYAVRTQPSQHPSVLLLDPRAALLWSHRAQCIDRITGSSLVLPMRCGKATCSSLTDLHARLATR